MNTLQLFIQKDDSRLIAFCFTMYLWCQEPQSSAQRNNKAKRQNHFGKYVACRPTSRGSTNENRTIKQYTPCDCKSGCGKACHCLKSSNCCEVLRVCNLYQKMYIIMACIFIFTDKHRHNMIFQVPEKLQEPV